jgi:hypothetical protein
MSTFTCNFARLKEVGADFFKAVPTETDLDALEAGLKCFNLHYLACEYANPVEEASAVALFNLVSKAYLQAEQRILSQ